MWQFCGKLVNRLPLCFRHPNRIFLSNGKHHWFVLLVEANFSPDTTNQKRHPDLGSDTSSVWICAVVAQSSFRGETSRDVIKCPLFSQSKGLSQNKVTFSLASIQRPGHWALTLKWNVLLIILTLNSESNKTSNESSQSKGLENKKLPRKVLIFQKRFHLRFWNNQSIRILW